jgi:ParB family chromosome partitioning protein
MPKVPISQIAIGPRFREALGDIAGLAQSIEAIGLLHPIVLNRRHELIAGRRRLEAAKELGWEKIEATVLDLDEIVLGEHAENACRKNFTPSEAVAIAKAVEALEKPKAAERIKTGAYQGGRGHRKPPEKFPASNGEAGKAASRAAGIVGLSRPTYQKAKAVVEAAEQEPEKFGPVQEEMDRTGKVSRAFAKVKAATKPAKSYDVVDDINQFRKLRDKLCDQWTREEDKACLRQFFRQLANEV